MKKNKKGFTILELLLYVSIVSIVIAGISVLLQMILSARIKDTVTLETEQQGEFMMQVITDSIRNAQVINAPVIGNSAASLSLNTYQAQNNPTIISQSGNNLTIKRGTGNIFNLNSSKVRVKKISFENLSKAGTPDLIRISLELETNTISLRKEFYYTKEFITSAAIRK